MELISRNTPNFKDLDLNFMAHPVSGDVTKLTGIEAVKRAVRNAVLTNYYERPFKPYYGSGVRSQLFENMNETTVKLIVDRVKLAISNFERRANVVEIRARGEPQKNGMSITVVFTIENVNEPITVTIFLERIR